jgi:hypothetical protein
MGVAEIRGASRCLSAQIFEQVFTPDLSVTLLHLIPSSCCAQRHIFLILQLARFLPEKIVGCKLLDCVHMAHALRAAVDEIFFPFPAFNCNFHDRQKSQR